MSEQSFSVAEIAEALSGRAVGDVSTRLTGVSEPSSATSSDLALAMQEKYAPALEEGAAETAILWFGADWEALGLKAAIFVDRPRMAMAEITRRFDNDPLPWEGIHPTALVDPSAKLANDVSIGPYSIIEPGASIGPGGRIGSHVSISQKSTIGEAALILDGVRIMPNVRIGGHVILHSGVVIGSDGFSFVTPEKSGVEAVRESLGDQGEARNQAWVRIHSIGGVEIGDEVEIGANSVIDAGTIRATRIGSGTKLDNLVHVGHNVEVGEDCLLCGQVGIAGSSQIGDRVVMGGQCGVSDNIFVGDDVIAGGASKIFTNVPAGRAVLGHPAVKMETSVEMQKALRRLARKPGSASKKT